MVVTIIRKLFSFVVLHGVRFLETYDHLSSALDENYITEIIFQELKVKQEHLLKILNGYIAYLKRRKQEG